MKITLMRTKSWFWQHAVRRNSSICVLVINDYVHCVQKKTPTHIFFHISVNYL